MEKDQIIKLIIDAFVQVKYPGDWCLRGSNEGEEPYLLEKEFKGKDEWMALKAEFLEQAPEGFGSALCFFSDEAFRFYLPAYMICDLRGEFKDIDVYWYLTHGLNSTRKKNYVNKKRYGERTWYDAAIYRYSVFNEEQVNSIIAYLEYKRQSDADLSDACKKGIEEALNNYWRKRFK